MKRVSRATCPDNERGFDMNRDLVAGSWNQFKGKVQVRWCLLIGDHLGVITGKRIQLAGERQSSYGALRSKTLRGVLHFRTSTGSFSSAPSLAGNLRLKNSTLSMVSRENH